MSNHEKTYQPTSYQQSPEETLQQIKLFQPIPAFGLAPNIVGIADVSFVIGYIILVIYLEAVKHIFIPHHMLTVAGVCCYALSTGA